MKGYTLPRRDYFCDVLPCGRQGDVGCNLQQRFQYEVPLEHQGMGYGEVVSVDDLVPVEQNVDVNRAVAVAVPTCFVASSHPSFDAFCTAKQGIRAECSVHADHTIEESMF